MREKWNKFGVGNLDTLGKEPGAREDLLKFHAENYSSNIMTLVILSKYSIEKMIGWAEEYFTDIPNHNLVK